MEQDAVDNSLLVTEFDWVSWDFYPSQWSPGTLLINWHDLQYDEFVAIAAPGVSLCGEAGLETACWRRARWESANSFFARVEPLSFEVLDLQAICVEIPPDFADWAADATAAHIERLRAFFADRPFDLDAAERADLLEHELEASNPGVRERIRSKTEIAWGVSSRVRPPSRLRGILVAPISRLTAAQFLDALGQLILLGLVYGFYRFVRESWAPKGVHVEISNVLMLPLGQFFFWLYGFAHLLLPIAFLGWLYVRRRRSFVFARNTLLLTALLSIAGYLALAPDPVYGVHATDSIPTSALATMPALHLTVALALAYLGVVLTRGLVATIAWSAYPIPVVLVLLQSDVRYPGATAAFSLAVVAMSIFISRDLLPRIPTPWSVSLSRRNGRADARLWAGW